MAKNINKFASVNAKMNTAERKKHTKRQWRNEKNSEMRKNIFFVMYIILYF